MKSKKCKDFSLNKFQNQPLNAFYISETRQFELLTLF